MVKDGVREDLRTGRRAPDASCYGLSSGKTGTIESPVIKRVELELGGNSPFVVLDDADLHQAVEAAIFGRYLHQGRICRSANRFIVDDAGYDDFVNAFTGRRLPYGDPDKSDTLVGLITNHSQFEHILDFDPGHKTIKGAENGRGRAARTCIAPARFHGRYKRPANSA